MSVQVRGYMCAKVRVRRGATNAASAANSVEAGMSRRESGRGGVYRDFIERDGGVCAGRRRKRPAVKRI